MTTRDEQVALERATAGPGQTSTVKSVKMHSVSLENGIGFGFPEHLPQPRRGDTVTLYTYGGSRIKGADVNGVPAFWWTEDDLSLMHRESNLRDELRRIETFKASRDDLDADYEVLPPTQRLRIDKFRATKGIEWRYSHEAYEMVCVRDSLKVAAHVREWPSAPPTGDGPYDEAWRAQIRALSPGDVVGTDGGHSGNTWDFARTLAIHELIDPAMVVLEHGALTPLVGCPDYGCPHPPPPHILAALEGLHPGISERIAGKA